jgi:hypothetical protein
VTYGVFLVLQVSYSLRFILLFANTDVSTTKIYLDTSIVTKSIIGQRGSRINFTFYHGKGETCKAQADVQLALRVTLFIKQKYTGDRREQTHTLQTPRYSYHATSLQGGTSSYTTTISAFSLPTSCAKYTKVGRWLPPQQAQHCPLRPSMPGDVLTRSAGKLISTGDVFLDASHSHSELYRHIQLLAVIEIVLPRFF